MAYQIVNDGSITPGRLKAILDLLLTMGDPDVSEQWLAAVSQPQDSTKEATKIIIKGAAEMGLILKGQSGSIKTSNRLRQFSGVLSAEEFRVVMEEKLLPELPRQLDTTNDLFPLYSAWSIANSNKYPVMDDEEKFKQFKEDVQYPGREGTLFNPTKYAAWRAWACFFGLGFVLDNNLFVPCPVKRLAYSKSKIVAGEKNKIHARAFLAQLAKVCPEMDGGANFNRVTKSDDFQKNRISTALSTAMRALHDQKVIELIFISDAESWSLSEDKAHPIDAITHVAFLK